MSLRRCRAAGCRCDGLHDGDAVHGRDGRAHVVDMDGQKIAEIAAEFYTHACERIWRRAVHAAERAPLATCMRCLARERRRP